MDRLSAPTTSPQIIFGIALNHSHGGILMVVSTTFAGGTGALAEAKRGRHVQTQDLVAGARLLRDIPRLLHRPLQLAEARQTLRRRFERRSVDFLDLLRRAVYGFADSPYRQLLRQAGCEFGDLKRLVGTEGIEGTLRLLFERGVFLTVGEFKGRQPVVRGSATLAIAPGALRNPLLRGHVPVQTSGSGGPATSVSVSLWFVRDHSVDTLLVLEAYGGVDWQMGHWGVPGGDPILNLLEFSCWGNVPVRWFSTIDLAAPGLHPRYRWSGRICTTSYGVRRPRSPASWEDPSELQARRCEDARLVAYQRATTLPSRPRVQDGLIGLLTPKPRCGARSPRPLARTHLPSG